MVGEIRDPLDAIVLRALEKNPNLRYQQVSQVKTMVETIVATPGSAGVPPAEPAASPSLDGMKAGSRAPYIVLLLLYLGLAAGVIASASWLPDRVASHFGMDGTPNGWMDRPFYLRFIAAVPVLLALVFAGILRMVRYGSAGFINLPRRDFWLAPERRALTARLIRDRLAWLLCLLTLFFGGLHVLTVVANRTHPPQLPMGGLLMLVMGFLLAVIVWLSMLLMRFAETGEGRGGVAPVREQPGTPPPETFWQMLQSRIWPPMVVRRNGRRVINWPAVAMRVIRGLLLVFPIAAIFIVGGINSRESGRIAWFGVAWLVLGMLFLSAVLAIRVLRGFSRPLNELPELDNPVNKGSAPPVPSVGKTDAGSDEAGATTGGGWRVLLSVVVQMAAALPLLAFMTYIVPKFVQLARDLGTHLPAVTVFAVNATNFAGRYLWLWSVLAVLLSWAMHRRGGGKWLWRWTAGVAAVAIAWFVALVPVVIIPMVIYGPQVIHLDSAHSEQAMVQPMTFGPVIERVLPFDRSFIDFQTGRILCPNLDKLHPTPKGGWAQWERQNGADALADEAPAMPVFGDKDFPRLVAPSREKSEDKERCVFVCEQTNDFNSVRAGDADARLKIVTEQNFYWGLAYGSRPWWFQTLDGAKGVLQILGTNDHPRGLKIRYKLVQAGDAKPAAHTPQAVTATGSLIDGATSAAMAGTTSKWVCWAAVAEADITAVSVGQDVIMTLEAFPQRTFQGRVAYIGNAPVTTQNYVTYETLIDLANPDPKFKAGMSVNVLFSVAQRESQTNAAVAKPASAETWSPVLAPGEKPDLNKIRFEADNLMKQGRYEEALQRHLWYFNHALVCGESDAVRLSFGLSGWGELARRYPKAREALMEVRDRDAQTFSSGGGYSDLFSEVHSINRELRDDEATVALFKSFRQKDPALAGQCYFYAEALLAGQGEYVLCSSYINNPQARFQTIRECWDVEKNRKEMQEHAVNRFVKSTRQLIEILVGAGRKAEAEKIRAEAVALLDDARLKSALSDAEEKVRHQPGPAGGNAFYIGQTNFPFGDSIEITSVERSKEQMTVKGHYNLVSHDEATLALYITTMNRISVPTDSTQLKQISKGRGDFKLIDFNLVPGLPHVSMYPPNGEPFAGIYFGTKDEVFAEGKLRFKLGQTGGATNAAAVVNQPPVVVETVPVSEARVIEPGETDDVSGGMLNPTGFLVTRENVVRIQTSFGAEALVQFTEFGPGHAASYHWRYRVSRTQPITSGTGEVRESISEPNAHGKGHRLPDYNDTVRAGDISITWSYGDFKSGWLYYNTNRATIQILSSDTFGKDF